MPLKTTQDEQPSLNMTPMIDIVFLLIIFFMVGTRFSELNDEEKQLPINVPEVSDGTALTAAPRVKTVHVFADGGIQFEKADVNLKQLEEQLRTLKAEYAKQAIVVRGDASSKHQSVVGVLDACRRAGIDNISLSVRIAGTVDSSIR